jgi:4-hydroxy-4-methyl-2-oxoglutarate aldolase
VPEPRGGPAHDRAQDAWAELRRLADEEEGLSCLASDALDRTHGMDATVAPMWSGARCTGPAFTVRPLEGDLGAVFAAIDAAEPGDVLVIEGCLGPAVALWGENTSLSARNRGLAGVVLGAPCRDRAAHARLGFPVFATGTTPRGARVVGGGETRVSVTIGGVVVRPGDAVIGDADGVTIVPHARLADVLAALPAASARDRATRRALAAGGTIGALRRGASER